MYYVAVALLSRRCSVYSAAGSYLLYRRSFLLCYRYMLELFVRAQLGGRVGFLLLSGLRSTKSGDRLVINETANRVRIPVVSLMHFCILILRTYCRKNMLESVHKISVVLFFIYTGSSLMLLRDKKAHLIINQLYSTYKRHRN